jgi:S1-C subfamily serine protease
MRRGSSAGLIIAVIVLSLIVGGAAGIGGAYYILAGRPADDGGTVTPPLSNGGGISVMTDEDAIVQAVGRADPAVVKVVSTVEQPANPFEYFFGGGPRVQQGLGSGFVFDYDGRKLVLTNTHVVAGAQQIVVQTRDGDEFQGRVLGSDQGWDVAVVELQGDVSGLPTLTLGASDELSLGEWVVAIGHPFAFDHTVTVGVVSAMGERPIGQGPDAPVRNVIQTDAAINQGNSGGPLINLAGEVVGINSMIFSPTGATVGIGFAVPINDVREIVHFLMEGGPWVGIETMPNNEAVANYLGLQTDKGVVVRGVVDGSPAAASGLRQGDVILNIGGTEIVNPESVRNAVFAHEIGDDVPFRVQRGTEQLELQVKTGRVPEGYFR